MVTVFLRHQGLQSEWMGGEYEGKEERNDEGIMSAGM
jgi:hypothetical protein